MSKKTRTKAELETLLAKEQSDNAAFHEWWICHWRGHATMELEVSSGRGPGAPLTVIVHGMTRAAGGVAVLQSGDYRDMPVFLDNLVAEWLKDPQPEIQGAARLLLKRREEYLALSKAG